MSAILISITRIGECGIEIKKAFGYNEERKKRDSNRTLNQLKVNFAHYGSVEQLQRFLTKDRQLINHAIIQNPDFGVDFLNYGWEDKEGEYFNKGIRDIWDYSDGYTIISSFMLQYNAYADISYTLHEERIMPLISKTLQNRKLSKKVLYGNDYHVVSNHATEKELWITLKNSLSSDDFRRITWDNPKVFLNLFSYI